MTEQPPIRKPHKRPPKRPPLQELIDLRLRKFPHLKQKEFATQILGVGRLHLWCIEDGRRQPSLDLAMRWVQALAPEANLSMFGPMPVIEQQVREAKRLAEIAPDWYQAA